MTPPNQSQMAALMMRSPEVASYFQQLFAGGVPRQVTAQLSAPGPTGFNPVAAPSGPNTNMGGAGSGTPWAPDTGDTVNQNVNTAADSEGWYGSNSSLFNPDGSVALPQGMTTGPAGAPASAQPIDVTPIGPPTPGGMGGAPGAAPMPPSRGAMAGTPEGGFSTDRIRGLLDTLGAGGPAMGGPRFAAVQDTTRKAGPFDPAKFGNPGAAKAGDTTAEGIFKMFLGGMMGA